MGDDREKQFTFGEQLKCMPGTGSVVTYIVIHRYRYSVPTMQKNLLLIIDLEKGKNRADLSQEIPQVHLLKVFNDPTKTNPEI